MSCTLYDYTSVDILCVCVLLYDVRLSNKHVSKIRVSLGGRWRHSSSLCRSSCCVDP